MVDRVVLPFSALNFIPGISGIDDVELAIPTDEDIRRATEEVVTEREEALRVTLTEEERNRLLEEGGIDPDRVARVAAEETVAELEGILPDFTEGLFGPLDIDVEGAEAFFQDITTRLEEIEGPVDSPRDLSEGELVQAVESGERVRGVTPLEARQELRRRTIAGEVQEPIIEQLDPIQIVLEGVQQLSGTVEDIEETVGGLPGAIVAELEAFLRDLPGGGILFDPEAFVTELVTDLVNEAASEESRENLRQAVESGPESPEEVA